MRLSPVSAMLLCFVGCSSPEVDRQRDMGPSVDAAVDAAECNNNETRPAACPAGQAGEDVCEGGQWTDGDCEPIRCAPGAERLGAACPDGEGLIVEECQDDGAWVETDACRSRACIAGASRTTGERCGLNMRGSINQECVDSEWVSTCADPDLCTDGTTGSGAACGLNGRGGLRLDCVDGEWEESTECVDPDECVDDTFGMPLPEMCAGNVGTQRQVCANGGWDVTCDVSQAVRVSRGHDGSDPDGDSLRAAISADGRYVAFQSKATNVVAGDNNDTTDIFVHDLVTGITTRESVTASGEELDGPSTEPAISPHGRFIAFTSGGNNVVPGDDNNAVDVFLRDRLLGTVELVSVWTDGSQTNRASDEPSLSADGRFVAFRSNELSPDDPEVPYPDIYLRDREQGRTTWVTSSLLNGDLLQSHLPALSSDGSLLAIETAVPFDAADDDIAYDAYLYDVRSGQFEILSLQSTGSVGHLIAGAPAISGDGLWVAYNLSTLQGSTDDGIFLRNLQNDTEELISFNPAGQLFASARRATVSADGRYVGFEAGVVYLRDTMTNTTMMVSRTPSGELPDGAASQPRISSDGRNMSFVTIARDLGPLDDDNFWDIYVAPTR